MHRALGTCLAEENDAPCTLEAAEVLLYKDASAADALDAFAARIDEIGVPLRLRPF
jgi:hypothetical protein